MTYYFRRLFTAAVCAIAGTIPALAHAQDPATISGRVVTEAGAAIGAASVGIPALQVGGYSNDEGRFSFTVPAASANGQVTVIARRVGYQPKSIVITLTPGKRFEQDFVLAAAPTQLEGIVVTALGIQKDKSQLGTAQQQLSNEQLTSTQSQNFVNLLQGKVSGVNITDGGTQGGSSRIVIRGSSSLDGTNQPLYVVDGVPIFSDNRGGVVGAVAGNKNRDYGNTVADINPNDIATISVLKGPNAAALYGSQAAFGVILITTKQGEASAGKIRTTWNSSVIWDKIANLPEYQNLYGQGNSGQFKYVDGQGGGTNDGEDASWGPKMDGRLIDQFTGPQQPWVPHPNNVRDFFNTGKTIDNNISVTGGTERANARLSVGSQTVDGVLPNNTFNKLTGALNAQFRPTDRLTTGASIQYIQNRARNRQLVGYSGSTLQQFVWFGRQVDINALRKYYDENGNQRNWISAFHNNPFWLQYENPQSDERNNVLVSASADYRLTDWLSAQFRTGLNAYRLNNTQNFAQGNITQSNLLYAGAFNIRNDFNSQNNTSFNLSANKSVTSRLGMSALAGTARRYESTDWSAIDVQGITVPGIYTAANAAIAPSNTMNSTRRQVNSVYGTLSATWDDWWTVEGTARNDWSSTLPKGNNSYFYPSVNTSVVLTNAIPSLKSNVLSYAKLRGSIARVGADANPYRLAQTYTGSSTKFGSLPLFNSNTSIANPTLKPEITKANEYGFELGFFDNRLTLDVTRYSKTTINQILNLTLPPSTGYVSKAINAGKITNKGFEALLSATPVRTQSGFEWTTTFNFSTNKSKIVELYGDLTGVGYYSAVGGAGFAQGNIEANVGGPFGVIVGYSYARDSATGKIVTVNGVPQRGPRKTLGKVEPDWIGGFSNEFKYKRASLGVVVDIHQGGSIYSVTNLYGTYAGVLKSSLYGREVDWDNPGVLVDGIEKATGQPTTTRITAQKYFQTIYTFGEPYTYDASFVKLREVRLGLDLPESVLGRMHVSSANISLVGRNLLTHKNIPNVDPEVTYSTTNLQGIEYMALPHPRSIGFNLRVTP